LQAQLLPAKNVLVQSILVIVIVQKHVVRSIKKILVLAKNVQRIITVTAQKTAAKVISQKTKNKFQKLMGEYGVSSYSLFMPTKIF
jgi:ABC-type tungstate transport system permease subunit